MSEEVADPTLAIVAYLKAQLGTLVNGNCYRPELPVSTDPTMPTAAIVVMPAGGGHLMAGNRLPVYDSLVDVLAYGQTRLQADEVARAIQSTLRQCAMVRSGGVLLYWARQASGLVPRIEPETQWIYTEQTLQVLHSELVLT